MNVALVCLTANFVLATGRVIQDTQDLSNTTGLVAPLNQSNGVDEKKNFSRSSTRIVIKPGGGSSPRKYKIVIKRRRHRTKPGEINTTTIADSKVSKNDSTESYESYTDESDNKTSAEVSGLAEWLTDPDPNKVPQIISDSEINNATFFQKVIVDLCKSLNDISDFWTVVISKFGLDLPETKLLYRYLYYIVEMNKSLGIDNLPLMKILVEIMEHTPISIHDISQTMSTYEEPVEKNSTNMNIYHIYEVNTANNDGQSFVLKGAGKYPDISGYAEHLNAESDEVTYQPSRRGGSLTIPEEIIKEIPEQLSLYDTGEFLNPPKLYENKEAYKLDMTTSKFPDNLKTQATYTNENETKALVQWSLKNMNSTLKNQQNLSTKPTIDTDDPLTTIENKESVESLQSRLISDKYEDTQSLVMPEIFDGVLEGLFVDLDNITTTFPATSNNDNSVQILLKEKATQLDVSENTVENSTKFNNETTVFSKPDDLKENITLLWVPILDERNPKKNDDLETSITPLPEAFLPNPYKYQVTESLRPSNATEYNTDILEFHKSVNLIKIPPVPNLLQISDEDLEVHELPSLENSLEYDRTGIIPSTKKEEVNLINNLVAPVIQLETYKSDNYTKIKPQLEIIDKDLEVESEQDPKKSENVIAVPFPLKVITEEPNNLKSKLDVPISPELYDQNKTNYEESKSLLLNDNYIDVDTLLGTLDDGIYSKPGIEKAILQSPLVEKSMKIPNESELHSDTSLVKDAILKEPEEYEKMKSHSLIFKKVNKTVPLVEETIQNESILTYKDDNSSVTPNLQIVNENYPIGLKPDTEFSENLNLLQKPDVKNNKLFIPAFTGLENTAHQLYGLQDTSSAPLPAGSWNVTMISEQNNKKTTRHENTNPYYFSTKYETIVPLSVGTFSQAPSELLGISNPLKHNKEKVDYVNDVTDDKDTGKHSDDKFVLPVPSRHFETSSKSGMTYDKNIMSVIPNLLYANGNYSNGFQDYKDYNPDTSKEQLDVIPILLKKTGDHVVQKHTSTLPTLQQSEDVNDEIYKRQHYSSKPVLIESFIKKKDLPTIDLQEHVIQKPGFEKKEPNELPTVAHVDKLQKLSDSEIELPQLPGLVDSNPKQMDKYDDIPALFENSTRNDGQFNLLMFPDYRDVVSQAQPVQFTDVKKQFPDKLKNHGAIESETKYDSNVFPSVPYSITNIAETKPALTKVNYTISSREHDNVKYPKAVESETKYRRTGELIYPNKEFSEVPPSYKTSYDYTHNPSKAHSPYPVYMIPNEQEKYKSQTYYNDNRLGFPFYNGLVKLDQNPLEILLNHLDPIYFNENYFLSNPNFHNGKVKNSKEPGNNLNRPFFYQGYKLKKDDDPTLNQDPKDKTLLGFTPFNKEFYQGYEQPKILSDTSDILTPPMESNQIDASYKKIIREKPWNNLNGPFYQGNKYKKDDNPTLNQDQKDRMLLGFTPFNKEFYQGLFPSPNLNEQPKILNNRSDILTHLVQADQIDESFNAPHKNVLKEKPIDEVGYSWKTPAGVKRLSMYSLPVAMSVTQENPGWYINDFNIPYSFVKRLITQLIEYFTNEIRKKCNQEAG